MPRATAGAVRSSTGGVAALGLGQKRSLQVAKTSAAVRQTRAALGEITNAVSKGQKGQENEPTSKKSLTSQVKRGLSHIVRRRSSRNQDQHPQLVKQESNPGTRSSRNRPQRTASSASATSSSSFRLSFGSSSSNSLPSSQEEESVRKLQEKLRNEQINLEEEVFSSDDESYHSASEETEDSGASVNYRYVPPPRVIPPANVTDFDLENMDDPTACSEYAADIFQYYKDREAQFAVPDYLSTQPEITEMMRAILVDWLVEVQESFELNHETLYTAVKLMDIFMSRQRVSKDQLQLVGATAALIACKTDERIPPNLDDFVYVCDDAYTRKDIVRKELEMVEVAGFDVGYPLSYRFLRRFGRVCMINMPDLTFARYILETSLTEYKVNVATSESLVAAAILVVALKIRQTKGWQQAFKFYAGYTMSDLALLAKDILKMLNKKPSEHLKTIRQKYSHRVFYSVANLPIPKDLDCWTCLECCGDCHL